MLTREDAEMAVKMLEATGDDLLLEPSTEHQRDLLLQLQNARVLASVFVAQYLSQRGQLGTATPADIIGRERS